MESTTIDEGVGDPADDSTITKIDKPSKKIDKPSRSSSTTKPANTTLYIGNLSAKVKKNDLRDLFKKYGLVSDVDVVGSFAFIVMPNEAEAEDAIHACNDLEVDGKKLIVEKKKAKPVRTRGGGGGGGPGGRGAANRDIQLFVAKCRDVPEEDLRAAFSKFGDVVNVQKPRTKPDIAFVSMAHFFEARKAIEAMNRKPVDGLDRQVFVQLSTNNVTRDGRSLQSLLERGETIKLFVGNLNKENTDPKSLGQMFERFGPVFDVVVMKEKGFGFVHMLSRESAEDAIRAINRRDFNGANITVTFSNKKGMSIASPAPGGQGTAIDLYTGIATLIFYYNIKH